MLMDLLSLMEFTLNPVFIIFVKKTLVTAAPITTRIVYLQTLVYCLIIV